MHKLLDGQCPSEGKLPPYSPAAVGHLSRYGLDDICSPRSRAKHCQLREVLGAGCIFTTCSRLCRAKSEPQISQQMAISLLRLVLREVVRLCGQHQGQVRSDMGSGNCSCRLRMSCGVHLLAWHHHAGGWYFSCPPPGVRGEDAEHGRDERMSSKMQERERKKKVRYHRIEAK